LAGLRRFAYPIAVGPRRHARISAVDPKATVANGSFASRTPCGLIFGARHFYQVTAFMAAVQRSTACLRISGDDLDPADITRELGCAPTFAQLKGERIVGSVTGSVRIARCGMWRLHAAPREPEDLDGQIEELLSKLSDNIAVWAAIAEVSKIDLFCGLFMRESNEGLSLSCRSMAALGARQIELGLDVYDGGDQGDGNSDPT